MRNGQMKLNDKIKHKKYSVLNLIRNIIAVFSLYTDTHSYSHTNVTTKTVHLINSTFYLNLIVLNCWIQFGKCHSPYCNHRFSKSNEETCWQILWLHYPLHNTHSFYRHSFCFIGSDSILGECNECFCFFVCLVIFFIQWKWFLSKCIVSRKESQHNQWKNWRKKEEEKRIRWD